MKKPELKDYELKEDDFEIYESQKKRAEEKETIISNEVDSYNRNLGITIAVLMVIYAIGFFVYCVNYDDIQTFVVILILYIIPVVISLLCKYSSDNRDDISWGEFILLLLFMPIIGFGMILHSCFARKVVIDKYKYIDKDLEEKINKYNNDLSDYKEFSSINEFSLVKVRNISLCELSEDLVYEKWLVFNRKYLANPQSFPDISLLNQNDPRFEKYYYDILNKNIRKNIVAKPKKSLKLDCELEFYYTCSSMYTSLAGKNEGDIVKVSEVSVYKILEVINPDD